MSPRHSGFISVDEQGRLVLPPDVAARLRLSQGSQPDAAPIIPYVQDENGLQLGLPAGYLARVYVEPTNTCNFNCRTCMRNSWDEPPGQMSEATFKRVIESLADFSPKPLVFFGGFGEPLSHTGIVNMVQQAKQTGANVELISNGSLLDETMARALVTAGLDRLWVSIDGATPESYADIRLGDALPEVIKNLEQLRRVRQAASSASPRLGIAFVAMRRNIHELPDVIRLGRRLGADCFSISNVLAHTPGLREETLYNPAYYEINPLFSEWSPLLQLPRFEINDLTGAPLAEALGGRSSLSVAGQPLNLGGSTCPFMHKRSVSVRWDGEVSPCLSLLHTHTSFLDNTQRRVQAFSFGSLHQQTLSALWNSPAYQALRLRLLNFDFSPCVFCNSCENAEHNQEDCFGNTAPTCGGCLWAQGFIQCP